MTSTSVFNNPDALPQLIGEFRPVDEWQAHINSIFYGLRGGRLREFYQTFSAADYRLAHATRAELCRRLGRTEQARASYERALTLTRQEPERRFLERRLGELAAAGSGG